MERKRADISFRIPTTLWLEEKSFTRLMAEFRTRPGITDELSLFTSFTHAPLPLEEIERRMEVASLRMDRCRQNGFGAGINVLATISGF